MTNTFYTSALIGVDAFPITVEVTCMPGDFSISIIGLQGHASRECRDRIVSAFYYSGISLPNNKFIVNLSPPEIKKVGSMFDIPIAVAILATLGKLTNEKVAFFQDSIIVGQLSLTGEISHVNGCLPIALSLKTLKKKRIIVPEANGPECSLLRSTEIITIKSLKHILEEEEFKVHPYKVSTKSKSKLLDINQVYGQAFAKRALEIAAAGKHHILFYGPPGSGKTMLASRLPTIMAPMTEQEKIECTTVYSVARLLGTNEIISERPFRSPHHTITTVGMTGGGNFPYPGEVTLAHNGVLFLDEFVEFTSRVLEQLRQILEDKKMKIKRADYATQFPANFLLVAALNPCPCGYFGSNKKQCKCTFGQVRAYLSKMSGPLLDRIDMQIGLQPVTYEDIENRSINSGESSADILKRVQKAVDIQTLRNPNGLSNGTLEGYQVDNTMILSEESSEFIKEIFNKMNITMRSYHKIVRVARTIADLDESPNIEIKHLKEALMYRSFDKVVSKFEA